MTPASPARPGRLSRTSARLIGDPLSVALAAVYLLMLASWVPQYLTWPWWNDLDHFATFAMAWDSGLRPYRDLPSFQFPGEYYLYWAVGKACGWGRTAPDLRRRRLGPGRARRGDGRVGPAAVRARLAGRGGLRLVPLLLSQPGHPPGRPARLARGLPRGPRALRRRVRPRPRRPRGVGAGPGGGVLDPPACRSARPRVSAHARRVGPPRRRAWPCRARRSWSGW